MVEGLCFQQRLRKPDGRTTLCSLWLDSAKHPAGNRSVFVEMTSVSSGYQEI